MKTALPLTSFRGLMMIDINVWNKKKSRFDNMFITLDTGASVTTVSNDMLERIGYDTSSGSQKRIITASGVTYVKSIFIDKIKIGQFEINNIEVNALTFPSESFSFGVLGLNVLTKFDINLLFSKKLVEFYKY